MTRSAISRWAGKLAVGVAALMLCFIGSVYVVSERAIHRKYDLPVHEIEIPSDSASIAEGGRLTRIRGCYGCHGRELQGGVSSDDFLEGRFVAPDLTQVAAEYSAGELARAIRRGVRANGEGLWAMPSPMYYHLSDADVGRIIAFLRAAPRPEEGFEYEFRPGPAIRWGLVTGDWWAIPEDVERLGPRMPAPSPTDTIAYGEYLARTSCTECHGDDLGGNARTPALAIARAYSLEEFAKLMRTGAALGARELPFMSRIARYRFSHFTDDEIVALFGFLEARGQDLGTQRRPNKR